MTDEVPPRKPAPRRARAKPGIAKNGNVLPPAAGMGRPKGSKNKLGGEVKKMIENALHRAGGEDYLLTQANKNPVAFLTLLGKILPKDVNVTGDASGQALVERLQRGRDRAAQAISEGKSGRVH